MTATIPTTTSNFLAGVNLSDLSGKDKVTGLVGAHSAAALLYLKTYMVSENYESVTEESGEPAADLVTAGTIGYNYILLNKIFPLLNLQTAGEGIIKRQGLDDRAAALLSGSEVEAEQMRLERAALTILKSYLNDDGLERLASVDVKKRGRVKIRYCGADDDDLPWWSYSSESDDSDE